MKEFFSMIQSLLQNNISLEQKQSTFDEFQILKNECMYVIDFNENKLLYKKGMQNVLGYTDDEMSLALLFETYHPDDEEIISKVIRESILHTIKDPSHSKDNALYLKYRRKRKDGSYVTVLSQSYIYDLDTEGNRMKSITRLTDVSFANDFKNLSYSFEAHGLDKKAFDEQIHKAYLEFFTKREMEVIDEIFKGANNHEIAETLCISEHTVTTHRKNILRKSACHNVDDLLLFCKANGILK
jgi:DNA-binding CsgD family transcriptional regulator